MRLSPLELLFCTALLAACERPTLGDIDDEGDAGGTTERDAGPVTSEPDAEGVLPQRDAGDNTTMPPPRPDAGLPSTGNDAAVSCADGDKDGVCDAEDNCPDDANAKQEDADKDGVGDACMKGDDPCAGAQVPSGVSLGSGTVRQLEINGNAGTLARVAPGESLDISLLVTLESCGSVGSPSLYLSVEDSQGGQCRPGFCSAVTLPIPFSFNISAPTVPGLHLLLAGLSGSAGCGTPAETPIAALCVRPKP